MSALTDTQNERDERRLPIDRVGVRSLRFPLSIRDRDAAVQHTVATVSLAVDLPHHFKGTHMSRFVEVLHAHGKELTVSNIVAMPRELMKKLHADKAHGSLRLVAFASRATLSSVGSGWNPKGMGLKARRALLQRRRPAIRQAQSSSSCAHNRASTCSSATSFGGCRASKIYAAAHASLVG